MNKSWEKVLSVAALALLVSGCSSTPQTIDALETDTETSWADLNSCYAFQEIVWTLDNTPMDAADAISSQEEFLNEGEDVDDPIVQAVLVYSSSLRDMIDKSPDSKTILEILINQPKSVFTSGLEVHQQFSEFCDSVGFTIYDDSFLTSKWGGSEDAAESPEPSEMASAGDSEKCFESMLKASLESNSTIAEKFLKETAENCGGRAQWYQALRMYPYAMGFSDVVGNELDILCNKYKSATACRNP